MAGDKTRLRPLNYRAPDARDPVIIPRPRKLIGTACLVASFCLTLAAPRVATNPASEMTMFLTVGALVMTGLAVLFHRVRLF